MSRVLCVSALFDFYVANETALGDIFSSVDRYLVVWDEKDGVGWFYSVSNSLCKSTKFVCRGCVPYFLVFGISQKLSVF